MKKAVQRLRLCEEVLALIDQKRAETGDECLDTAIERSIIDMNLMELERDILQDPGALQPWLVPRRRSGR